MTDHRSILDLPPASSDQEPFTPPRRKRITCVFCGGFAFVAETEVRLACRDCRHDGLVEPEFFATLQREVKS